MSGQNIGGSASVGLVAQSGNWIMQAADGSGNLLSSTGGALHVSLTTELPAGSNIIGSLANNQSVNVSQISGLTIDLNNGSSNNGTLRVTLASDSTGNIATIGTSITPGTSSTNLGKAIDNVVGATDTGVAILVRRKDSLGVLTPIDGDYTVLNVNNQGALWTQVSSPVNLNATIADDANFTVASGSVFPVGYLCDENSTDTVDEGDAGLARITTDRKQIIAGSYLDDTPFTPAGTNSYLLLLGAQADETAPDSVDEGDVGALRMTLTRFLKTSMGDLISGENQTTNRMMVEHYYSGTNITSATTTTVLSGAGLLHSIVINKAVATGVITIYDNTAGSGTVIGTITFGAALLSDPPIFTLYNRQISTGITIVTSAATDITVMYRAG